MAFTDHFGARLKELRTAAGLSQKQLAEKAGVSQRGISHLEQGINKPSFEMVAALCEALGVDCNKFLESPTDQPPAKRGRPRKSPPAEER